MAASDSTTELITSLCESHVLSGPFGGMRYETEAVHSAHLPKLLGGYEREFHACLERFLRKPYARIVNIGCGEGYYAVGLAMRLPQAQIHAFDIEPRAQELCRALAAANGVAQRVHVHEGCTIEALGKVLKSGSLILCDNAVAVADLLRRELLPVLNTCDLLVKLPESAGQNQGGQLLNRFRFTHAIQEITALPQRPEDLDRIVLPLLDSESVSAEMRTEYVALTPEEKLAALDDGNGPNTGWAALAAVSIPTVPVAPRRGSKKPTGAKHAKPLITACILARNEEHNIEEAIQCLRDWTDEILVIDNESEDATVAIAGRLGARIFTAPRDRNFDGARNLAIDAAAGDWIFYLDADERVPIQLGTLLRRMVEEDRDAFDAVMIPFKSYFCGQWMRHCGWWPGYTRPQLLRKGAFRYGARLHSGVEVEGRTFMFPFEDAALGIDHYSYEDVAHFIEKTNRYTDGECENLDEDGISHGWQGQLAHFLVDWHYFYERNPGYKDGMRGFIVAFLYAMYRFTARAKLWHKRYERGQSDEQEPVPASVQEMVDFMATAYQNGAHPWLAQRQRIRPAAARDLPGEWLRPHAEGLDEIESLPEALRAGITVCIIARNEACRIEGALRSVQGWADRIIVVDNESSDATAEIARRFTDHVLTSPPAASLQQVRFNAAEEIRRLAFAEGDWLLHLDADERIPFQFGAELHRLVREHGDKFEALDLPFKNIFYGKWMQSPVWWPGNQGPRLVKKGAYDYDARIHTGLLSKGRTFRFPSTDPEMAVVHEAYETIGDYLEKLNRYTNEEAISIDETGSPPTWQKMLGHFTEEWHLHYDRLQARQDGMHGFVQSFFCAFYRFAAMAKAWDLRRKRGEALEAPLPTSIGELLSFMTEVLRADASHAEQPRPGDSAAEQRPPLTEPRPAPVRLPANPVPIDPVAAAGFRERLGRPLRVVWEGDFTLRSSLALVNRELCLEMLDRDDVELSLIEGGKTWHNLTERDDSRFAALFARLDAPLSGPPDVTIRHHYPPNWERPASGKLIVIQPWELSHLPDYNWVEGAIRADEVWVPSRFVRDVYTRSGVPAEKVKVVPNGVRLDVFTPEGAKFDLPTKKRTRFLFVGGSIFRKGPDLLLKAYLKAFRRDDDVCLIVKDMGTRTFYQWGNSAETMRRLQSEPGAPELIYLDEDMDEETLASLYRACTSTVLPYRGEGFGLPPLEGMACGLPAIVTAGGATDDYADDQTALRVPARRVLRKGAFRQDQRGLPVEPWEFEPDIDTWNWTCGITQIIPSRSSILA